MAQANKSQSLTVGFFPDTFPRDPIAFANFYDHLLSGQILEPLVETSNTGEVLPRVADSWKVSSDGKIIEFELKKNLLFSDGSFVKADDVKYTLLRHRDGGSQSASFLNKIESIETLDGNRLRINLRDTYGAILKALSREHLGIVPDGWTFDPSSNHPFVGTGPYDLVKQDGEWFLNRNPFYHSPAQISIDQWKPIFYDVKSPKLGSLPAPDLIPYAMGDSLKFARAAKSAKGEPVYQAKPVHNFMHVSAWRYPHSVTFTDADVSIRAIEAIRHLLHTARQKHGAIEATGAFPFGIDGYITATENAKMQNEVCMSNEPISVHVAVIEREFNGITSAYDANAYEKLFGLKFKFTPIRVTEFGSLKNLRPDILVFVYAGGFHDPEGFLVVLPSILQTDLETLLGSEYSFYLQASQELEPVERKTLFEKLNQRLIASGVIAPGWMTNVNSFRKAHVSETQPTSTHTIKLMNYGSADRE